MYDCEMHLLNAQAVHPLVKERENCFIHECGLGYENGVKIVYRVHSHNSQGAPMNLLVEMGKCHED